MPLPPFPPRRFGHRLALIVVLLLTLKSLQPYVLYFPPDFASGFLVGRREAFFAGYRWAFYPHIAVGPVTLVLGTLLVSGTFRRRFPGWHRALGRVQGLIVLLGLVPSGLWMARFAAGGPAAGAGLAALALATAGSIGIGWRAALQRRFADHERWMFRTYLLLCSALVLRVGASLATAIGVTNPWYDPVAVWASWLGPLVIHEIARRIRPRRGPLTG